MTLLAGCTLTRQPGRRYASQLPFAELALAPPLPSAATLRRWRADLPEPFVVSLLAPATAVTSSRGPLRRDPSMEEAVRWTVAAAEALRARAIVVETPFDLSPGARDREVLRAYFAAFPRGDDRSLVWRAAGVWKGAEVVIESERSGVVPSVDPIEDEVPPGPFGYARLVALGTRQRLGDGILERVVDALAGCELSLVAIATDARMREAQRLLSLAREPDTEDPDPG